MSHDLPFKIAILVLLILMRVARWRARRLIRWKVSWPALKKDPVDVFILLVVCGVLCYTGLIAYFFFSRQMTGCTVALPDWVRWGGFAVGVTSVGLMGWGDYALGSNLSIALEIKKNHTLVTTGPYRWIRHPIYASVLLFAAAMFPISANWLVGACFLVGIGILCMYRIPREEKMLIGAFGNRYRRYMERTGRVFPRIIRRTAS